MGAVREAKAEDKEATEADKAQEIKEKNADNNFLNVLEADCEKKAGLWDQRSQTRAAELTAMDEALGALKTGVAPNWKVNAAEDHFVKVRQIIKDLIAKLESDASAEATQKSFCDKYMRDAATKRDTAQSTVEQKKSAISGKEAEKAQLHRDIAELSAQIAANKKALLEATELREKEKAENLQRIEDAGAGKASVEQALNVLKQFYSSQGFLQYVPTNSV